MDIKLNMITDNGLQEIQGKLVDVVSSKEEWSEYKLEDGTIIKVKNILVKLIDFNQTNPDGTKAYATQFQPVINVIEPLEKQVEKNL